MAFVSEYFDASTTTKLAADAVHLPLSDSAMADLLGLLTNTEDFTYLALKSEQTYEVVKAHKVGSMIVLDRAQEGTSAVLHPMGTCVATVSPLSLAVMKEIACNYNCCDGDCPCTQVTVAGQVIPAAIKGTAWEGAVLFNGDAPITIGVNDAPAWVTATVQNGVAKLSGTPTKAGTFTFSVSAANCGGTKSVSTVVAITVTE